MCTDLMQNFRFVQKLWFAPWVQQYRTAGANPPRDYMRYVAATKRSDDTMHVGRNMVKTTVMVGTQWAHRTKCCRPKRINCKRKKI